MGADPTEQVVRSQFGFRIRIQPGAWDMVASQSARFAGAMFPAMPLGPANRAHAASPVVARRTRMSAAPAAAMVPVVFDITRRAAAAAGAANPMMMKEAGQVHEGVALIDARHSRRRRAAFMASRSLAALPKFDRFVKPSALKKY